MDGNRFDRWTRRFEARLSRRGLSGVAATVISLRLAHDPEARARQDAQPGSFNTYCLNLGTPCGDTSRCQCRLDTNSNQICVDVVEPPDGRDFVACLTDVNCDGGAVCDTASKVCVRLCATLTEPLAPRGSGSTTCLNLGTACGNTAICQCRLDKRSEQTCQNVVIPPDGVAFRSCDTNDDCAAGLVCDATESFCRSTCAN
jgi:hypothetical protein